MVWKEYSDLLFRSRRPEFNPPRRMFLRWSVCDGPRPSTTEILAIVLSEYSGGAGLYLPDRERSYFRRIGESSRPQREYGSHWVPES